MRQAIEKLMSIVEAMVADGDLHDLEIQLLDFTMNLDGRHGPQRRPSALADRFA